MSVYANGLEIAGKAKDGKSTACSPDPCFSPPSPSAGWIVIPYANTTKAKDTANASKTVFIEGKPVMLKDKSYFKTSTGNEGAAGPKGVSTGVKKGKAYFTSWSMDIKVEGYNVCRHSDMITHNHGSTGNTTVWHYNDGKSSYPPKECFDECVEIEKHCGDHDCEGGCKQQKAEAACGGRPPKDDEGREAQRRHQQQQQEQETVRQARRGLIGKIQSALRASDIDLPLGKTWKWRHCLTCGMLKPGIDPEKQIDCLLNQKKKLEEALKKMDETLFSMDTLNWERGEIILQAAGSSIARELVENMILKRIKFWETAGDLYNLATNVDPYQQVKDIIIDGYTRGMEAWYSLQQIENFADNMKDATTDDILSMMKYCASKPCLRARKCMLEPYDKSKLPGTIFDNEGCCPGQTAHHLIPNSMYQSRRNSNSSNVGGCAGYRHDKAPNVCMEGATQNIGTHKEIHVATREKLQPILDNSRAMTYEKAKEAAIAAHQQTFPGSQCSKACLEKQLDAYRDEACGKGANPTLRQKDGMTNAQYDGPETDDQGDDYC